ncbi:hypothetical protein [uncultured Bradyrhizobium sp.]|uniref:hypothetical protein n=1 Tax=uncultured Bradyrhizobium sp. TaxID=199684 RepID=UPI0035CADD2F
MSRANGSSFPLKLAIIACRVAGASRRLNSVRWPAMNRRFGKFIGVELTKLPGRSKLSEQLHELGSDVLRVAEHVAALRRSHGAQLCLFWQQPLLLCAPLEPLGGGGMSDVGPSGKGYCSALSWDPGAWSGVSMPARHGTAIALFAGRITRARTAP